MAGKDFSEMSDEALQAEAERKNAANAEKARHCRVLFDRAVTRRSQITWLGLTVFLVPLLVLGTLLSFTVSPLVYVVFGLAWAWLGSWLFKLERLALREVEERLEEWYRAGAVKSGAAEAIERREFSKKWAEKEVEWQAFKAAHPEEAKALIDKYRR